MSSAKAMRAQARKMNQMARTLEMVELSQSKDPKALQTFLVKEATRKITNKARAQVRKTLLKGLGL